MGTTNNYQDFDEAPVKDPAFKGSLGTDSAQVITTKQAIQKMIAQFA